MANESSLSAGQALGRWILYVIIFIGGGGLAAGLSALGYEWIVQGEYAREIYAIIFGVSGYVAYRLAERVMTGPPSS